ncbi:MAG: RluA family pseudouridine synthase [Alphaproteobacteria bacterium]|nr:RluA family pseudouridine synthase [Alphaproteobacteria bacterium]
MATRQSKTTFLISKKEDGQKLRPFLHTHFKGLPLSTIHKWCRKGQIRVNSGRIKFNHVLQENDLVRFPPFTDDFSRESQKVDQEKPPILYEDDALLIVDKPAGLAVQGHEKNLLNIFSSENQPIFPVHRLDMATQGCVVLAKTHESAKKLSEDFKERRIKKTYLAEVFHAPQKTQGVIETPLVIDGRTYQAETIYKNIGSNFLLMRPKTGRKHQLRRHCVETLNTPILGEKRYADRKEKDLHLLAYQLILKHPETDTWIKVKASLPVWAKKIKLQN